MSFYFFKKLIDLFKKLKPHWHRLLHMPVGVKTMKKNGNGKLSLNGLRQKGVGELRAELADLQTTLKDNNEKLLQTKEGHIGSMHMADFVTSNYELGVLNERLVKRIEQIRLHLTWIDSGMYGLCTVCEGQIPLTILKHNPKRQICPICAGTVLKAVPKTTVKSPKKVEARA